MKDTELHTSKEQILCCINFTHCPPPPQAPRGHPTKPPSFNMQVQCPSLHPGAPTGSDFLFPHPPKALGEPLTYSPPSVYPQDSICPSPLLSGLC